MPAARDSSSSAGSAASVGWGGCGGSPSVAVAQQADHGAQVLERLVRAGADHAGGARDLLGRRVGAELQRAGVQAQQRDPVREHVVHLARDPRPLGVAGLLDAQLLLGPGATLQLALRLAAPAEEHAQRRRPPRCTSVPTT